VHARIHTKGKVDKVLTVPRTAVTRIDGKPTVLVLVGEGTVEPRAIRLGAEDREKAAVIEGLKEGDKVIIGGLFALKSEIFR
jgi:multidrug efflux pump subunit AcrA (membrane-fusion protein)